jgi:hypothetical protein
MNRVQPLSTSSSIMASASSIPDWGWAFVELSILTAMSFRSDRVGSSTGMPFRGDTGPVGSVIDTGPVGSVIVVSANDEVDAWSEATVETSFTADESRSCPLGIAGLTAGGGDDGEGCNSHKKGTKGHGGRSYGHAEVTQSSLTRFL